MPDRSSGAAGGTAESAYGYGEHSPSPGPKALLTGCHLLAVAAAVWLLTGGADSVVDVLGIDVDRAGVLRRSLLAGLSVVYLVRLAVTTYVLQTRRMPWSGAAVIGSWVIVIHVTMASLGGANAAATGAVTWLGVALYVAGSVLNTGSELQRKRWKQAPGHQGRLYTGGLFRYAVHVNYFGDLVLFTGFALVTGRPWALVIPALMACIFRFGNIPPLERHLAQRYGAEFTRYSARTARLVPFIY